MPIRFPVHFRSKFFSFFIFECFLTVKARWSKPRREKECSKRRNYHCCLSNGGVAQLVRALACHARGRGFESRHSRHSIPLISFYILWKHRLCVPNVCLTAFEKILFFNGLENWHRRFTTRQFYVSSLFTSRHLCRHAVCGWAEAWISHGNCGFLSSTTMRNGDLNMTRLILALILSCVASASAQTGDIGNISLPVLDQLHDGKIDRFGNPTVGLRAQREPEMQRLRQMSGRRIQEANISIYDLSSEEIDELLEAID